MPSSHATTLAYLPARRTVFVPLLAVAATAVDEETGVSSFFSYLQRKEK
jgi:hypothetical protein